MSIKDSLNRSFANIEEFATALEAAVVAEIDTRVQAAIDSIPPPPPPSTPQPTPTATTTTTPTTTSTATVTTTSTTTTTATPVTTSTPTPEPTPTIDDVPPGEIDDSSGTVTQPRGGGSGGVRTPQDEENELPE
jgi:hypothetical protein